MEPVVNDEEFTLDVEFMSLEILNQGCKGAT